LECYGVFKSLDTPTATLTSGDWSESHVALYQCLDTTITECMLSTECGVARRYSTKYNWLPALTTAIHYLWFWSLKLRYYKGGKISLSHLQFFCNKAGLHSSSLTNQGDAFIITQLKQSYQEVKQWKPQHTQLQKQHLEGLAEAIVLNWSPGFNNPSMSYIREDRVIKQVKQLICREQARWTFHKIGCILWNHQSFGLSCNDILDTSANGPNLGDRIIPNCGMGLGNPSLTLIQ
jgi:hypothetical protein